MVMTREEVLRATGPTSGAHVWVRMGVTKDGRITAGDCVLKYQAGAFAGSPVQPGAMCALPPTTFSTHVQSVMTSLATAQGSCVPCTWGPISEYGVECVVDELAQAIGMDPIELRMKNAAKEGTKAAYGPTFGPIGFEATLKLQRPLTTGKLRSDQIKAAALHPVSGSTLVATPAPP